jgi:hypothetical protein
LKAFERCLVARGHRAATLLLVSILLLAEHLAYVMHRVLVSVGEVTHEEDDLDGVAWGSS